jgi:hypothetical protein
MDPLARRGRYLVTDGWNGLGRASRGGGWTPCQQLGELGLKDAEFVQGAAFVPVQGGGRRRVRVYAATRQEARDKLDQVLDDAQQGIRPSRRKQTMGDYLDYWLTEVARPELRPTTYSGYEIMVRRHIKPVLGRTYLADLSPADVRRLLATLRTKETTGHGGGPRRCPRAWCSSHTPCSATRCPTRSGRS